MHVVGFCVTELIVQCVQFETRITRIWVRIFNDNQVNVFCPQKIILKIFEKKS